MIRTRTSGLAAVLAVLAALGGCSQVAEQEAAAAATAFAADPSAGCGRLAPDTAKTLAEAGDCPGSLPSGLFGQDDTVLEVEVAGESAIVRFPRQVIFLARFPQGWLVTAAGCVRDDPDPAAPYECEVHP